MADDRTPFHNPFAALRGLRAELPEGPAAAPPAPSTPGPGAAPAPARAVVRLERKGRGGKEVTVVEALGLADAAAERWLRELKQALGCGGVREGEALVFQGDHRPRLVALLEARGVRTVSRG
jgi:translation initiation factor 1